MTKETLQMDIKVKADEYIKAFEKWSNEQIDIKGVAVAGSFARGDFHSQSDIDLVIICANKEETLEQIKKDFRFHPIEKSSLEEWGILTSLRIFYCNGLEVEYGIVTDEWVKAPLDEGTKRVITNGFAIMTEKDDVFSNIKLYWNKSS